MTVIRTCVLTYDGKGFKFDNPNVITPVAEIKAELSKEGYDYDSRNSVLTVMTFELQPWQIDDYKCDGTGYDTCHIWNQSNGGCLDCVKYKRF